MDTNVKSVFRGLCIKGSPVYSSHFIWSLGPKYSEDASVLMELLSYDVVKLMRCYDTAIFYGKFLMSFCIEKAPYIFFSQQKC